MSVRLGPILESSRPAIILEEDSVLVVLAQKRTRRFSYIENSTRVEMRKEHTRLSNDDS